MKWQPAIAGVLLIMAGEARSQTAQVTLSLELKPTTIILGEPLGFKIIWHNGTNASVALCTYDGQGFKRWLVIHRPGAAIEHGPWLSRAMPTHPLASGETAIFEDDLQGNEPYLLNLPGRYEIWAEYESPGRVYEEGQVFGEPARYQDFWKGIVHSSPSLLEVHQPTGVDLEAYEHSNGQPMRAPDVLQKFPTSTYVAYTVRGLTEAQGLPQSDLAKIVTLVGYGLRAVARTIPCPPGAGCDPNQKVTHQNRPEQAIDWSARWIDFALKAHPDIWFADELRLRLALDEIAAGKSALGASDLENLSKHARPDIAEKAGQILTLVKQKGLIK